VGGRDDDEGRRGRGGGRLAVCLRVTQMCESELKNR
jgi:hypothetical protein